MNERQSRWSPAATRGDGSPEELANATCALCGIELSIISLVPDGGPGSAEVRWYCRDIVSCTERWTANRARPAGQEPAPEGDAPDAEQVPDEQATTEEPAPAGQSVAAGQSGSAEEPEREEVRAGQSGGGGRQDVG